MSDIETAEEFACKRIPFIRKASDDNVDLLESVLARDVERRDAAVAREAKLELLTELDELFVQLIIDSRKSHDPLADINGAGPTAIRMMKEKYRKEPDGEA